MSCGQVVAVLKEMNMDLYNYCSEYYTKKKWLETYAGTMYPIERQSEWEVPQNVKDIIVLPSVERLKSGRPKKRTWEAGWEKKQHIKCNKCGDLGHTKRTCIRRHQQ
ncbi:uncharacterized protein LOC133031261 [Cannabis sativa]|uniref:uncharacterized protein LOC133031261 n=1 Tax=Cannabis sativa TaxID=3483 RepID=UPI0029CAA3A5|nr:uncharacterized protein LOC133031261 [Cannabis sativa]